MYEPHNIFVNSSIKQNAGACYDCSITAACKTAHRRPLLQQREQHAHVHLSLQPQGRQRRLHQLGGGRIHPAIGAQLHTAQGKVRQQLVGGVLDEGGCGDGRRMVNGMQSLEHAIACVLLIPDIRTSHEHLNANFLALSQNVAFSVGLPPPLLIEEEIVCIICIIQTNGSVPICTCVCMSCPVHPIDDA